MTPMNARETPPKTRMTAAADEAFLRTLGERVRDARARRGMTRRILARDSGVSERYLAQLETGLEAGRPQRRLRRGIGHARHLIGPVRRPLLRPIRIRAIVPDGSARFSRALPARGFR